jgi:hypothetical protein
MHTKRGWLCPWTELAWFDDCTPWHMPVSSARHAKTAAGEPKRCRAVYSRPDKETGVWQAALCGCEGAQSVEVGIGLA